MKIKVKCYWNLNKAKQGQYVFSVVRDGKVIGYTSNIHLTNARFHVNDAARQKIADGGKKSVHAWVIGEIDAPSLAHALTPDSVTFTHPAMGQATYNPRRDKCFTDVNTGARIDAKTNFNDVVLRTENKRGAVYYA
jgi:hypothetical protein